MNKFNEPYYIPAQGQPEQTTFLSTINPNIRLAREENVFSTATTDRARRGRPL